MESKVKPFSVSEHTFKDYIRETNRKELLLPAKPFPDAEMTKAARKNRLDKSAEDFWAFDSYYFTPDMYSDGYYPHGDFHENLLDYAQAGGVQIVLGARGSGKTPSAKKMLCWLLLTGRIHFAGAMSENLMKAWGILYDICRIIRDNPRIRYDYAPIFIIDNDDEAVFHLEEDGQLRTVRTYSERRTVRGETSMFDKPEFILCDDLESRESSIGKKQTEHRVRFIAESVQSMQRSATLLILANNFDEECAMNRLKTEAEKGLLPANWSVHIHPAWDKVKGSVWAERYPAESEDEMRAMCKPYDDSEWAGDFQQTPVPPEGNIFKRQIIEYKEIPSDCCGVIWTDPNLSKKGKGDTTATGALLYSHSTRKYYIVDPRCKSFSDSNEILNIVLMTRQRRAGMISIVGWDGSVTQESTWTQFIWNWCEINHSLYPRVEYRHYTVDNISKTPSSEWNDGNILVPEGIMNTDEGKRFMSQIFGFEGKWAGKPDDAPDWLICAYELIQEMGIPRRGGTYSSGSSTVYGVIDNSFL